MKSDLRALANGQEVAEVFQLDTDAVALIDFFLCDYRGASAALAPFAEAARGQHGESWATRRIAMMLLENIVWRRLPCELTTLPALLGGHPPNAILLDDYLNVAGDVQVIIEQDEEGIIVGDIPWALERAGEVFLGVTVGDAPREPRAEAVLEGGRVEQREGGGPFARVPEIHHRAVAFRRIAHIDAPLHREAGAIDAQERDGAHVIDAPHRFVGSDQHGQAAGEISVARSEHRLEPFLPLAFNLRERGAKVLRQLRRQLRRQTMNGLVLLADSNCVIDGERRLRFQG